MNTNWPHNAITYQIYPRSFQDTDDDGIGNIAGITKRLEHVKSIGANTIWLSPFYPSPQADFGYDIADYCDVAPEYGTLNDFRQLLASAHDLDIRVLVDLVPNHTSDQHDWFKQSAQSRDNPYSDWYVWRDAQPDGSLPNNWLSIHTSESAWQWHDTREQYYLHTFNVGQPDLNWENPQVGAAIRDAMRFWLNLGVDGFRVDAVHWIAKDPELHDDPANPDYQDDWKRYASLLHTNSTGWPGVNERLRQMADVLQEPAYNAKPRFMVIEAYPLTNNPIEEYKKIYSEVGAYIAAPFNFEGMSIEWSADAWRNYLTNFYAMLDSIGPQAINCIALGNHDQPRMASRFGDDAARAAAVLLYTLPGMSYVYNGDEIGMTNTEIPPELIKDVEANGGAVGRDPARTPTQWDDSRNAGFSNGESTWLPINPNYSQRNVVTESADPQSFLSLYRALGVIRQSKLNGEKIGDINVISESILSYVVASDHHSLQVYVNFSDTERPLAIDDQQILISSYMHHPDSVTSLRPHEAIICQL